MRVTLRFSFSKTWLLLKGNNCKRRRLELRVNHTDAGLHTRRCGASKRPFTKDRHGPITVPRDSLPAWLTRDALGNLHNQVVLF
jgi:hypothetical protein